MTLPNCMATILEHVVVTECRFLASNFIPQNTILNMQNKKSPKLNFQKLVYIFVEIVEPNQEII